jgi:hypothetical protein
MSTRKKDTKKTDMLRFFSRQTGNETYILPVGIVCISSGYAGGENGVWLTYQYGAKVFIPGATAKEVYEEVGG